MEVASSPGRERKSLKENAFVGREAKLTDLFHISPYATKREDFFNLILPTEREKKEMLFCKNTKHSHCKHGFFFFFNPFLEPTETS